MKKITLLFLLISSFVLAQPGTIDTSFNTDDIGFGNGYGAPGNSLRGLAVQPDGKILVGGTFSSFNGNSPQNLARLNPDGKVDPTFNIGWGTSGMVNGIKILSDGKLLVYGGITNFNGTAVNRIFRLNENGTLDTTFVTSVGLDGNVNDVVVQPDGKIVLVGLFTTYNGTSRSRIARLNADGTLDTTFVVGTGFTGSVEALGIQSDGKIVVGGNFSAYNGTAVPRLIRLTTTGARDVSFTPGTGPNAIVYAITMLADNSMYLGGEFNVYNGTAQNAIVRIGANGVLDPSFAVTGLSQLFSIVVQPDQKVLIGGSFSGVNGVAATNLARLNPNGTTDTTFETGTGASDFIFDLALQPDGKVLACGNMVSFNGFAVGSLVRLESNGANDVTFNKTTGANSTVYCSATQPDGKILLGGGFVSYNNKVVNRIVRTNADGSIDSTFNSGVGTNDIVYSISPQPDGKIIIGGFFTTYNNVSAVRVARLNADGSLDTSFNTGTGADGYVYTTAVQPDGKVLIGGLFTNYNGVAANRIVRLNADGTPDTNFAIGTASNSYVQKIVVQPDGKILVVGGFTNFNGTAVNKLVRLNTDGTVDTAFNTGTGFVGDLMSVVLQPDGKMVAVGDFTSFNGNARNRIVRLNADGSIDNTFNVGSGFTAFVRNIDKQADGSFIVIGTLGLYNGNSVSRMISLMADGSIDTNFALGTGPGSEVVTAVVQPNGTILIGGQFTSYNGTGRNRIARINGNVPPTIVLTTSIPPSILCDNQSLTISFSTTGSFASGNIFTAQLSDASGSFTSPVSIGTLESTSGGDIAATIPAGTQTGSGYRIRVVSSNPAVSSADNGSDIMIGQQVTYYVDADADGFGNAAISTVSCMGAPDGYVENAFDCNDALLTYADFDGDGFGSQMLHPCGVTNNSDCDDNQLQYVDADSDGFGSGTYAACGVTNNSDCNDALLTYVDNDGDGFGSTALAACGVTNSTDCDDNQLQYVDADADGFGSGTYAACGVMNNSDCNDALLTYVDNDGDGFGSTTLAACGVTNSTDCDDNQLQYVDADADGFGSGTYAACGVMNNSDCNDALLMYVDGDGDGFGSTTLAACGVTNSTDCDDNQLQYVDADADGFGSGTYAACGVMNNSDCNDALLMYVDGDGDGFGSTTLAACGVTNSTDCDDNQLQYVDADGDGFGSGTYAACGVINNSDCNDALLTYVDGDGDGFGSTAFAACGVTDNTDCDDNQLQYVDADGDGFGSGTFAACGVLNNFDCNDFQLQYVDADGDGYGSTTFAACGVTNNTDCDDTNPNAYVGTAFYIDADGDGYGSGEMGSVCSSSSVVPDGYSANNDDCDDTRASVHPFATEIGYNLIDDDCDGFIDEGFPPKNTIVNGNLCNTTLPTIDTQILANLVAGAQGYRWRVTNLTGPNAGQVQILDTGLRVMKLTQLASYAFDTQYKIEVAVYFSGFLQPYNAMSCTVTTPKVFTSLIQCNQTLTSLEAPVYARLVPFASGYRFRITDAENPANAQVLERNTREFRMNLVTAFAVQGNSVYNVEVAVKNTDGTWLLYGTLCNVTTPAVDARLETAAVAFDAQAYPNPFSDNLSIKVSTTSAQAVSFRVYDMTGRLLEQGGLKPGNDVTQIGNRYPAGVYNVVVSQGGALKTLRIVKR